MRCAVFAIWLLLMALIWLYLLGIATFFSSPVEVLLTILIGAFSAVGIMACVGASASSAIGRRVGAVFAFAMVQVAAMWLSFMPVFANR